MVQKGKPDPEIYLTAAKALALEPAVCMALEDSPNGIRSAFAAGCTDGVYQDTLLGEKRDIAVRSISYTGWKLVGVIPGRDTRDEQGFMGGYHIDIPLIRVIYEGGVEVLTMESRRQAEELFALLRPGY